MNVADTRLCLLLHSLPELDDQAFTRLLLSCGSPAAVVDWCSSKWPIPGIPAEALQPLALALSNGTGGAGIDIDAQLDTLDAVGAVVLPITDSRYPVLLRTIHDPPPLLYVRGNTAALKQAQLAVVGSRKASAAGTRAAGSLAGQAVQAGLGICSGLALGIDAAAHRGALAAAGKSVAVMATGIDGIYPSRHRSLAGELQQAGCLVTEFPLGLPPLRYNFPRRNRIISGMSLGALVIEAAQPSGSLITARTAMEQGREVFALPWSIYHHGGAGCLRLIRDGAKMVESIGDILEELGPLYVLQQDLFTEAGSAAQATTGSFSDIQQQLLALVGYETIGCDELAQSCSLPVALILAELSALEVAGLISRSAGGYMRI
jgi:DNA processing protein